VVGWTWQLGTREGSEEIKRKGAYPDYTKWMFSDKLSGKDRKRPIIPPRLLPKKRAGEEEAGRWEDLGDDRPTYTPFFLWEGLSSL